MKKAIEIDFPPRFAARWGYERQTAEYINEIFVSKMREQSDFINLIGLFSENFINIEKQSGSPIQPQWKQNWFPPLDGMSSYAMVAGKKPDLIIEIGSGNSTKFFGRSIRDHDLSTKIWSIDPKPRAEIDEICDRIFRCSLEDIDLNTFDSLKAGDILFFDGSHRSFQNSDVTVFFIDVLPRIPDNVFIGIHDIFWPYDYPERWVDRYYNEQYLLAAYMLAFGRHFPLVFSCSYSWRNLQEKLVDALSSDVVAHVGAVRGGCFWFEKKTISQLL